MERVRLDTLPEYTMYKDAGCEYHPACLSCPFERCRFDQQGGLVVLRGEQRAAQLATMLLSRVVEVDEVMALFGISRRSAYRLLAQARLVHQSE